MTRLALFVVLISLLVATMASASPVASWHFEPSTGDVALDSASKISDPIPGLYSYSKNGVSGKCLKLDGFTSYVRRAAEKAPKLTGPFSIEAWVALQQYPWNWTAIVDRSADKKAGYYLGIDYQGALGMSVAVDGKWVDCSNATRYYSSILHTNGWDEGAVHTMLRVDRKLQFTVNGVGDLDSAGKVPSGKWTLITVVYSSSGKFCKIYFNGKLDNTYTIGKPVTARIGASQIGGWNGGDRNYNGKMDDFRIYGRALSDAEVASLASGAGPSDPVAWWKFDDSSATEVADSAGGKNGTLSGGKFASGKFGSGIELDGATQHIEIPEIGNFDDFSYSVWVNPVIESAEMALHTWNHVVGTYDPQSGISVYLNGQLVGTKPATGAVTEADGTDLLIGLSHEKSCPIQTERGPSTLGTYRLLDGLIDEVNIYDTALTPAQVKQAYEAAKPAVEKPLDYWQMPTGPLGKGEFGASYEALKYGDSWDNQFRTTGPVDVVVKFDQMPVNYVFWHGWNYGLCMVSENGLLMADQSVERGNENGCMEHMSDKEDRYSHMDIVENNDARVVLKWRYAPVDIFYNQPYVDAKTGWGDWVEEYFYIYPDGVMMREQNLWTTGYVEKRQVGGYGGDPSNQETLFFSQPGKGPLDTVDVKALTMANDAGDTATFAWQPDFPWGVGKGVADPTIQMVNFKSVYKPYMMRRPGAKVAAFPPSGYIDRNFPYWNHWPVSMLPNDGRKGTRTDRPAHTSLTWFVEPPVQSEGMLTTWIYMYGLTDKKANELTTVSKSWNSPAAMTLTAGNLKSEGYSTCQHAYLLSCVTPGKPAAAHMTLAGNQSTPVLNPALVIKGWGDKMPVVKLNGKVVPRGENNRIGVNYEISGADMVIWLKMQSTSSVSISLTPQKP